MRDLRSFDVWHVFIFQQNFCKHIAHNNYVNYVLLRYPSEACLHVFIDHLVYKIVCGLNGCTYLSLSSSSLVITRFYAVDSLLCQKINRQKSWRKTPRLRAKPFLSVLSSKCSKHFERKAFYFLLECLRSCFSFVPEVWFDNTKQFSAFSSCMVHRKTGRHINSNLKWN